MKTRTVNILETPDGWKSSDKTYSSAMAALLDIKEQDQAVSLSGEGCMTIIKWTATSRIGKAVLRVITS
jgi:hypothetical protein